MGYGASVWVTVLAGTTLGGVVKGLTGFGSAIIQVLIWVSVATLGSDGGPLTLSVVTDSISTLAGALPLIAMTDALTHVDWAMLISIMSMKCALSPVGAAMLAWLNPRVVELVMAWGLAAVILVSGFTLWRDWRSASTTHAQVPADLQLEAGCEADKNALRIGDSSSSSCTELVVLVAAGNGSTDAISGATATPAEVHKPGATAAVPILVCHGQQVQQYTSGQGIPRTVALIQPGLTCDSYDSSMASRSADDDGDEQGGSVSGVITILGSKGGRGNKQDAASSNGADPNKEEEEEDNSNEEQTLLTHKPSKSKAAHAASRASSSGGGSSSSSSCYTHRQQGHQSSQAGDLEAGPGGHTPGKGPRAWLAAAGRRLIQWYRGVVEYLKDPGNRRTCALAAAAGAASGVMEGMTGMGGPPIMLLYLACNTPKEVVRAINCMGNLLQFRLIAYIALGLVPVKNLPIHAAGSVLHIAGCALGALVLFPRVEQRTFRLFLLVLMVLCCVLLFGAAAGVTSSKTGDGDDGNS